jgi:hypothetical protein
MKKNILFAVLLLASLANAQSEIDTTIKVDLLRAPASPAANLLGFATSDIDKPTDVSAFMLSLQSASTNFTKLPSNYAVDIAPYWFFKNAKKGDITTEGFRKSSGADVFKQTLVVSFAFRNPDSTETEFNGRSTYGGLGFKFSILRGKYDAVTNKALDNIKTLQDIKLRKLGKKIKEYKESTDPGIVELRRRRKAMLNEATPDNSVEEIMNSDAYKKIDKELDERLNDFTSTDTLQAYSELDKSIQQIASSFQTARVGWTWDISGGVSAEFRDKRFDNSKLYNAGLWTTIGYTDSVVGSGLLLLRILHNPDRIFAKDNAARDIDDILTFDAGLRYIYAKPQSKFSASLEAIYRSILTSGTLDPSWRLVFNAEYAIWQNQKLTFSFGRNFDGTISKGGNLIAALTFLAGFGNKR